MFTTYSFLKGQRYFTYKFVTKEDVPPQRIRDVFNDNFYHDRAATYGEFEQYGIELSEPSENYEQEAGTTSEIVIYHKQDAFVAEVHFFVLPFGDMNDGNLIYGASGKPDPKELIHDETIFYISTKPRPRSPQLPKRRSKW